jgi:hypothetical protein
MTTGENINDNDIEVERISGTLLQSKHVKDFVGRIGMMMMMMMMMKVVTRFAEIPPTYYQQEICVINYLWNHFPCNDDDDDDDDGSPLLYV